MANYIENTSKRKRFKRSLFRPLAVLFIALVAGTGAVSTAALVHQGHASADAISDLVCNGNTEYPFLSWAGPDGDAPLFGKDSLTYTIYRFTHTDDLHFAFESKSTVNAGTEDVDGLLNSFIQFGKGETFTKVNEKILGANLTTGAPEGEFNGGPTVTAFDRFGLAGLSWTRYNGEWRYPYVDICSDSPPRDLKLGVLYPDRLEPLTTYDGIQDTKDVRTAQFGNGLLANLSQGFLNTTANWTFDITKGIVAGSIALVNLSFADFTQVLGLNDLIGSPTGIFANLYRGIYQPLIGLVFVAVGLLMLYKGIIKREFRGALGMLFRSIALFMVSVIMFTLPLLFMTLPNNVAVVLQSLVINTMSSGLASGSGICTTNGSESSTVDANKKAPADALNAADAQDLLTQASSSMRSIIGCQLWATFLVKPWSLGQFGADYNQLYAEGHIPSGAYGKTGEVKIDNSWMVGDAAVPVGGGSFIYNWALFQISTETNAHSPVVSSGSKDGETKSAAGLSPYTNGVANDWYRVVDAMSNYNEQTSEIQDNITASNNPQPIDTIRFAEPDLTKKPTAFWSSWVGNDSAQRIGIAFTSILGAAAGLLTVFLFAFLSAIYGFGIIIVMAFAPLFFLAGSWGDRGWEIFKGWAQLVLNLVVKRVMVGIILVLNLIILTTVLNMMSDEDYFWGIAALALVSFMLWKFKSKILDTVGGLFTFNFANENIEGKVGQMAGKIRGGVGKAGQTFGNAGVATIAGGFASKKNGGSFKAGAAKGLKIELRNQSYRYDSDMIRQMNRVYGSLSEGLDPNEICPGCGQTIISEFNGEEGRVIVDADMNKWHEHCAKEELGEAVTLPPGWGYQDITLKPGGILEKQAPKVKRVKSQVDAIRPEQLSASLKMTGGNAMRPGTLLGKSLAQDLYNPHEIPDIPEILAPYLDQHKSTIEALVRSGDPQMLEAVVLLYAKALVEYAYDNKYAEVGEYSLSPDFAGSRDADVESIYSDMMKEVR